MTEWLLWVLLVIGCVYLTTSSFILAPIRMLLARGGLFLRYFMYCPMCQSFWIGMALYHFFPALNHEALWLRVVGAGVAAVGAATLASARGAFPSMFDTEQGARA